MYSLNIDCGTANDNYYFDDEESYREFMKDKGCGDTVISELLTTGNYWDCPDTYTLKVVYPTYELSSGSIIQEKSGRKGLRVVNSIDVNSDGVTEVNTQECWLYVGKLCYDYECYGESSVEDIYKVYNLVGEDFKLFK